MLKYFNRIDNKYKSEYTRNETGKVKNSLFELAKDYEKFKEKEKKLRKDSGILYEREEEV